LYFAHAYKYVFRNPVRAGVCNQVEDYRYSSISGQLGLNPLRYPIFYPFGLLGFLRIPKNMSERLDWLNRPFLVEHQDAIQKALGRTRFEFQKSGQKEWLGNSKNLF
jgi:hypothetical protein